MHFIHWLIRAIILGICTRNAKHVDKIQHADVQIIAGHS